MFDSHVNTLGDDSVSDLFVDYDSDSSRVDVEDAAGSSVVVFVGHAFVDGSVDDDVNDVSDFVGAEGFADVDGTNLSESFSKFVSGSAFISIAVGHGNK